MQPLLSIIVVAYNVERYLQKCLASLSNDFIDKLLVDVMIIDDASEDDSWRIIERFCRANANFRAIRHEINLGAGAARNTGLDHCSGQYVWFVDGDDYIDPDRVPEILRTLSDYTPDVLVVRPKGIDINGREFVHHASCINSATERLISIDDYYAKNIGLGYSCLYIARHDIVKKNNIRFKSMRFLEDEDFHTRLFIKCTNIWVSNITCYNYVKRPSSISNDDSVDGLTRRLVSLMQVHASLAECIGVEEIRPKMRQALKDRLSEIEFLIMRGYLFTKMSAEQALSIIDSLSKEKIYPFRCSPEGGSTRNTCYRLAKQAVNSFPILTHHLSAHLLYPIFRAMKGAFTVLKSTVSG